MNNTLNNYLMIKKRKSEIFNQLVETEHASFTEIVTFKDEL